MEYFMQNPQVTPFKVALTTFTYFILLVFSVEAQGQVTTPCTASMIATFTPCLNYITGSSAGGSSSSSPTSNCCDAWKSLTRSSVDCACLMVTASVPLPQIVNRTLALGLPRFCKADGVPLKCEATGSPLPSPGPVQFGAPPAASPPNSAFSPQASKATTSTPASEPTATGVPPVVAPSSFEAEAPSRIPRIVPVLTPSASASASMITSPTTMWTLLLLMGFTLFKL